MTTGSYIVPSSQGLSLGRTTSAGRGLCRVCRGRHGPKRPTPAGLLVPAHVFRRWPDPRGGEAEDPQGDVRDPGPRERPARRRASALLHARRVRRPQIPGRIGRGERAGRARRGPPRRAAQGHARRVRLREVRLHPRDLRFRGVDLLRTAAGGQPASGAGPGGPGRARGSRDRRSRGQGRGRAYLPRARGIHREGSRLRAGGLSGLGRGENRPAARPHPAPPALVPRRPVPIPRFMHASQRSYVTTRRLWAFNRQVTSLPGARLSSAAASGVTSAHTICPMSTATKTAWSSGTNWQILPRSRFLALTPVTSCRLNVTSIGENWTNTGEWDGRSCWGRYR